MTCSVYGCDKPIRTKGFCNNHYMMNWRDGRTHKIFTGEIRSNPLYVIWWQRKRDKLLCEHWTNHFNNFLWDVLPKPKGNYYLVRIKKGLFGPDNFKWQECLKRKEDESKKDWHARKRAARILANPSMESDRNIKRVYGLTREQYDKILLNQNNVCAICEKQETAVNGRTGSIKSLAVDHCHNTGKIRGLLCWRCNATIGKLEENLELIDKMKSYLIKHKDI